MGANIVTSIINFVQTLVPAGLMPYWVFVSSVVTAAAALVATLPAPTAGSFYAKFISVLNVLGLNVGNAKNVAPTVPATPPAA